ncbi:MAG: tRNA lysidine(34) synthetase TilS [Rubrobacteridae bacterium]|nr:tRNA lysidine(34) synthetase TilS [Rubrobacteridae bacterium]
MVGNDLEMQAQRTIETFSMLIDGDSVMVAVSGGPDSIALLHFLNSSSIKYGIRLSVFHLNHNIRGKESDEDEQLVKEFAELLGLPIFISSVDVPAYAASEKLSLEEAAREVRYEEMEKTTKKIRATKIALGHHADDQV